MKKEKVEVEKLYLEKPIYNSNGDVNESKFSIDLDLNDPENIKHKFLNVIALKIKNGNFKGGYIISGAHCSRPDNILIAPRQIGNADNPFLPIVFNDREIEKIVSGKVDLYSFDASLAKALIDELADNYVFDYCSALVENKMPLPFDIYAEKINNFPKNAYLNFDKVAWGSLFPRKLSVTISKQAKDTLESIFISNSKSLNLEDLPRCKEEVGNMIRSYIEEKQAEVEESKN